MYEGRAELPEKNEGFPAKLEWKLSSVSDRPDSRHSSLEGKLKAVQPSPPSGGEGSSVPLPRTPRERAVLGGAAVGGGWMWP